MNLVALTWIVGAVAVLGLALITAGIIGIARHRRRVRRSAARAGKPPKGPVGEPEPAAEPRSAVPATTASSGPNR